MTEVSGATRLAAVIGDPVRHSLSPVLHNAAYRELGLDWVYVAFEVPDGEAAGALDAMRTLRIDGLSVTMPHKTAVAAACDAVSPDAAALRSVNTVTRAPDGRLVGDSTDGEGFLRSLRDASVDPAATTVLVLGSGGAARAVSRALGGAGAKVSVCARRPEAAGVAAVLADGVALAWEARAEAVADHRIIVNATPIGMVGNDGVAIPLDEIGPGHVVVDLVYHPLDTPLLAAARERGALAVDGLGMLVHQAGLQIERWTGQSAPIAAMRAAALRTLDSRYVLLALKNKGPFRRFTVKDHCHHAQLAGGLTVLQGTFETLALTEVLGLLGHARKTGALWLEAGPATAAIYLNEGRCCAAQSGDIVGPVDDAPSLLVRLVDICFAAARTEEGSFRFGHDEPPWSCPESVEVDLALDELGRLLDEWRDIQAFIPSLDCRIKLSEELGSDGIVLDRERWQLLVAIDGRRSVRELVRKVNRPVLDICHAIVALIDAGAVSVLAPPAAPARTPSRAGKAAFQPAVQPETPWGPGVESPNPGPGLPGADEDWDEAPAEKGQYLRVFSGLRDA